jgi:uncharacterized protein DUF1153
MRDMRKDTASDGVEEVDVAAGRSDGSTKRPGENRGAVASVSPPPIPVRRWVPHRKAELVAAVRGGYLSLDAACKRYDLTVEEFLAWQHGIDLFGMAGLRVYKPREGQRQRKKSATGKKPRRLGAAPKRAEPDDGGLDV